MQQVRRIATALTLALLSAAAAGEAVYEPETGILTVPSVRMGSQIFPNAQILLPPTGNWTLMSIGVPTYAAPPQVGQFPVRTTISDFVGIAPGEGGVLQLDNGQYWQILSGSEITCTTYLPDGSERDCLASDHHVVEVTIFQMEDGYLLTLAGMKGSVKVSPMTQPNITRLIETGTIERFVGATPGTVLTLDNGHRYLVAADSASLSIGGILPSAKVTVYQLSPDRYSLTVEGFATALTVQPIL